MKVLHISVGQRVLTCTGGSMGRLIIKGERVAVRFQWPHLASYSKFNIIVSISTLRLECWDCIGITIIRPHSIPDALPICIHQVTTS